MRTAVCLVLLLLAVIPVQAPAQPAPYHIDWLGQNFYPTAINDRGQVIGLDILGAGYGPALRWEAGRFTDLGEGQGNDINNNGVAVLGVPIAGQGQPGAVVVAPDGTRTDVGLPQGWGGDFRHEFSINDAGQVVGMQKLPIGSDGRAFLWDAGRVTYLELGFPTQLSSAHAINNAGQVVGWWSDGVHAGGFLWKDGTTTVLPAHGVSINNRGQVLLVGGEVWKDGAVTAPVPALTLLDLSDPTMGSSVQAREINDAGQVVGWSEEMYIIDEESGHGLIQRGVLWDDDGGVVDLNAAMGLAPRSGMQFPLAEALDVNNLGQIVGFGPQGGWLLTPVPEPTGAAAFVMAAWAYLARRKRCRV
jgi:probable HAF family extracellular repeat protein